MARQKKEDVPAGSPAWMTTFSDLMNLLLCFFVLLFSMSTVDAEKFQIVIASLQSHFSVLQGGGTSIGEGEMVGAGLNQLQYYDTFYNPDANSQGDGEFSESGESISADDSVIEKGDKVQGDGSESQTPGENGAADQDGMPDEPRELTEEELQDLLENGDVQG